MKLLYVLASLFAAVQSQVTIGAPQPGATLVPGQSFTVQLIEAPETSPAAGIQEVDYFIGIVSCGTSTCPSPSANLGDLLFVGPYQPQGIIGNPPFPHTFENFTFTVPTGISGAASIQVQRVIFTAEPGEANASLEYGSLEVQVAS